MSNSDSSLQTALNELETVMEAVKEELASWRRRAIQAESQLGSRDDVDERGDNGASGGTYDRVADLEGENQDLKKRVGFAKERVDGLLSRLQFLEQQVGESGDIDK